MFIDDHRKVGFQLSIPIIPRIIIITSPIYIFTVKNERLSEQGNNKLARNLHYELKA